MIEDIEKVACGIPCGSECPVEKLTANGRFAVYVVVKNNGDPTRALEFMGEDPADADKVGAAVSRVINDDCPHYNKIGENYGEDF